MLIINHVGVIPMLEQLEYEKFVGDTKKIRWESFPWVGLDVYTFKEKAGWLLSQAMP